MTQDGIDWQFVSDITRPAANWPQSKREEWDRLRFVNGKRPEGENMGEPNEGVKVGDKWEGGHGQVRVIAIIQGYAMLRRKHAQPWVVTLKMAREHKEHAQFLLEQARTQEAAAPDGQPYCHADNDGECDWKDCPQLVDYQKSCPLWVDDPER